MSKLAVGVLLTRLFCIGCTSTFQSDLQAILDQYAASGKGGLQLGWVSATESFSISAGNVTNPGSHARKVTPQDTFNYGSGTKAVVAAAVMRLADAGKISLNDKVSKYVDPYLSKNNGTTLAKLFGSGVAEATVLQVLRMEAGIPDFEGRGDVIDTEAEYSDGQVFPPYAWLRAGAQQTPPCVAGSCSYYSSTSYEVAGLILAAVQNPTGDYDDLDFGKAFCGDSAASRYPSIKLPGSKGQLKDTMSVAGMTYRGVTIYEQNPTIMGWSCGGMMANTQDVARFFFDLLDESSPHPLVSTSARSEMTRLKELTSGYFRVSYGAGLMDSAPPQYNKPTTKGPSDWGYIIGHIGETFAFHAINGYMPKAKAAMSIVTNSDYVGLGAVDLIACKVSEAAAKAVGDNVDLGCSSPSPAPSWDRRRRRSTVQQGNNQEAMVDDIVV